MIPKNLIQKLKSEIEGNDKVRSEIISKTHALIRRAKHIIFRLHRAEIKEAHKDFVQLEKDLKALAGKAAKALLRGEGSLKAAVEEYLEAKYLFNVLENKKWPQKSAFPTMADEELSALADLTGELVRAATLEATKGDVKRIKQYRDTTEELFGVLLSMNLHSALRQKRDDARRNLRRLEEVLYDLSLKGR